MKRAIKIILITLFCMAVLDGICQTVAKGNIISDNPYKCYIQEYNDQDSLIWVRFDVWEYYGSYSVKIDRYDRLDAMFIDDVTGDSTMVSFTANAVKRKFKKDLYIDGSNQIIN